ncbi:DUF4402 domain-containing protein [Thiomicrospira microaerophila]|uniref:DUF4402 domain-containing protein n=1 Tax=Thiomicrospira microaerophila TaxID=406020 RepID=UPI0005C9014A|nr:DUF4402 domain-containing protein [Thiomicrospira microaerophila]
MKKLNFKMNKIAALVASGVLASAAMTSAKAETLIIDAQVEINENITLTEVNPLNFGMIIATAAPTVGDQPTIIINPQSGIATPTDRDGTILIVDAADITPAEFNISDAAPNVPLTMIISFRPTGTALELNNAGDVFAITAPTFSVNNGGPVDAVALGNEVYTGGALSANPGGANVKIGATLAPTAAMDGRRMGGGIYAGTFSVEINY